MACPLRIALHRWQENHHRRDVGWIHDAVLCGVAVGKIIPGMRPSGIESVMRVAAPGMIAFTVMLYFASATALL